MESKKSSSVFAGAGILTALLASLCCITPVLALIAGASGMAASFSWLEPFRPYLIALTAGVLGFAWYQKLRPRTQEEIDCACDDEGKTPFLQSKMFLGIVTVFALVMMAFPYYADVFYPAQPAPAMIVDKDDVSNAHFDVKGMTCTGCEEHVKHAVFQLPGIISVTADHKAGTADVQFDKSKVTVEEIKDAILSTGYTVTDYSLAVLHVDAQSQ